MSQHNIVYRFYSSTFGGIGGGLVKQCFDGKFFLCTETATAGIFTESELDITPLLVMLLGGSAIHSAGGGGVG